MKMPLRRSTTLLTAVAAASALGLSACGSSEDPTTADSGAAASEAETQCKELADSAADAPDSGADTFVFAASADPVTLNPFHASDGETFRISRQIFEGLVAVEPCTPDPTPGLATEWESSEDGKSTTFTLEEGVTFHDGTPFNAEAVCKNFEYFNNQPKGPAQSADVSYYWLSLFKGFADSKTESIYESCEANGDTEVTITLNQPFAGFVASMSLPAFSMQSPTALEKYDTVADGEDPTSSPYATAHPTGTGPYKFSEWNRGKEVRLVANEDYWNTDAAPKTPNVVIPTIEDPGARRDALTNGDIDGYDLVAPGDIAALEESGQQIVNRPAFNVLYLGMNQAVPELADIKVRQAIAHAIDKEEIVAQTLPEGSVVANQFVPDSINGYSEDVTEYEYDVEKAKSLLAEAGAEDLTLDFNYPVDVSRPYMPSPVDTFNVLRTQLKAAGITVKPVSDAWSPDYLDKIQGTKDHGLHLLGWTGDYNDTDNFLGVFFGAETMEWGFNNQELFDALTEARQLPTVEEQQPLYEDINEQVMDYLPGVPIAHPVPSLAFAESVQGFIPSPVQDEPWNQVVVTE
ncbi:MAG TPA: ABC transporter substrate-binding protein [Nocardioidaceae bacterium]|nr:ABC transporter substrate-binding protein [Nocardioidaceae bacterium]